MKIKYIGTPGEDHQSIHMYGTDFPLGKFVTVTDLLAIRKLSNHPHFTAQAEHSDVAEDAQIKREFETVANTVLAPVEAQHIAQAEGENNGNADGPVPSSASEAPSAGSERARRPGRPRKSN